MPSSGISKTALGPRLLRSLRPLGSFGYALGRHLFQNPSEKGGISAHNVRSRAVIMTVPKFCQNFSRNASGRLWEHKTPSSESLWRKILALIISPKSDHNEGKSEFQGDNDKITWRSRAHGQNARPRAPPAAFGLPRPAVYGSPQAAGGALGAGIFARGPRPAM